MTGIDGNFALLQIVRADQSVKWKKSTAKDSSLTEEESYFLANRGNFVFAQV